MSTRAGAVDLVGQDELVHQCSLFIEELPLFRAPDRHARDISGQEIGSELDTAEIQPYTGGQTASQRGLADSRHILDQHVKSGAEGHQQRVDLGFLSHENAGNVFCHRLNALGVLAKCLLRHASP